MTPKIGITTRFIIASGILFTILWKFLPPAAETIPAWESHIPLLRRWHTLIASAELTTPAAVTSYILLVAIGTWFLYGAVELIKAFATQKKFQFLSCDNQIDSGGVWIVFTLQAALLSIIIIKVVNVFGKELLWALAGAGIFLAVLYISRGIVWLWKDARHNNNHFQEMIDQVNRFYSRPQQNNKAPLPLNAQAEEVRALLQFISNHSHGGIHADETPILQKILNPLTYQEVRTINGLFGRVYSHGFAVGRGAPLSEDQAMFALSGPHRTLTTRRPPWPSNTPNRDFVEFHLVNANEQIDLPIKALSEKTTEQAKSRYDIIKESKKISSTIEPD